MASSETHGTIRPRRPWALTLFGLLSAGGLIAMPLVAGPPDGAEMPDMVRFIGRFHRVLLHLPIGVFVLILIQELGSIFFRRGETTIFPIFFGAASAILAVVAGFLLYHDGGYEDSALAERHLWGGLAFAVAAIITFVVKTWTVALAANTAFYRLLLFGSVGVMMFASHDGASLTHGPTYLTAYAPDPIRRVLGMEPRKKAEPAKPIEDRRAYVEVVQPIFERHCVECHREGNVKGRFRMDTYELLVKGGREGDGLEPGDAEGSNIIYRMELPIDDEERMPPDEKPGLTEHEMLVLKWWIDTGADPEKTVGELEADEAVLSAIAQIAPAAPSKTAADDEEPVAETTAQDDGLQTAVAQLSTEFPGALTFESQNSPYLTFTAVSLRGNLDDEMFAKLAPVIPHLVSADLNASQISDRSIALLTAAENLRLIRLAETEITDEALDSLVKIPSLESVNLYGTKVTDEGVLKLAALPNLKRLYLWQTEVSDEAIADLQEKLPDCRIIKGI